MLADDPVLIAIELLAASVWVGSLVCLAVVGSAARASLDPEARVSFFRALGRRYGIVGDSALAVAIGVGLAMVWPPAAWDRLEDTAVALAGALVAATGVGVRQARAMTRLRRNSLVDTADELLARRVTRGARVAAVLRGIIALVTLAIVLLVARIIGG